MNKETIKKLASTLIGLAVFFIFLGIAPSVLSNYIVFILNLLGIYILLTLSLNLTNGYTGIFNLGHAGFAAIGAYVSVLLTYPVPMRKLYKLPLLPPILGGPNYHWPFLPAVLMGGLIAALIAIPVGLPALRVRGHYLAVLTLGFMVIVETVFISLKDITKGALGISAIPVYTNLWWVYGWVLILIYVTWILLHSSYGRAMLAIREDEIAASAMGINITKFKLFSFVLSAFFQGIAGALYAHLTTNINPYDFSFGLTFLIVIMLIVGGAGTITGCIIGASLITIISYALKPIEEGLRLYGLVELIYAGMLIAIMIWRPTGITGGKEFSISYISKLLSKIRIEIE